MDRKATKAASRRFFDSVARLDSGRLILLRPPGAPQPRLALTGAYVWDGQPITIYFDSVLPDGSPAHHDWPLLSMSPQDLGPVETFLDDPQSRSWIPFLLDAFERAKQSSPLEAPDHPGSLLLCKALWIARRQSHPPSASSADSCARAALVENRSLIDQRRDFFREALEALGAR